MKINALINASLHTGKSPHSLEFKGKKVLIKLSDTSPPLPAGTLLRRGWAWTPMVLGVEGGGKDFRLIAEADIQARENYISIYIYFLILEKLRK